MFARILACFVFVSTVSFAQLTVSNSAPYNSANYLINGVLMSSSSGNAAQNVTVSSGQSHQIGYFNGTNSNIGMDEGVILSTNGIGWATPQSDGNEGPGNNSDDPDLDHILTNISNSATTNQFNVIVYEFDFVAGGTEVEFEYVFASNEYTQYTCSQFNDVFGFFISGPGISGPYSNNAKNIALIPNPSDPTTYTNTPVMINTVNSGVPSAGNSIPCASIDPNWTSYSTFFTENSNVSTVFFNGFTKVLKAKSNVECGETYHIKLAIADVGDEQQNSAVFLKKGSFEAGSPLELGIQGQTSFVKCVDHVVIDPLVSGGFGDVQVEWSQNGTVFSNNPIQTFTENGTYTITVSDICNTLTHTVVVTEYTNMDLNLPDTVVLCDETEIIPDLTGGAPIFDYKWTGAGINANSPTLTLAPGVDGLINLTIEDNCDFQISDDVFIITPEELSIDAPDQVYLCEATILEGEYTGGYGEITSYWELNGVIYNVDQLTLSLSDKGIATYHVIDECGVHLTKTTVVASPGPFEPIKVFIERSEFTLCDRDEFTPPMVVTGGAGGVSYQWFIDGIQVSALPNYRFKGVSFTEGIHTLSFKLTDVCGNTYEDAFTIEKIDCYIPNVFSPNEDLINDGFYFPVGNYQTNIILRVYDRWGKEVFYSKQYERCNEDELEQCWTGQYQDNGKKCLSGVYFYTITFKDGDVEKGTVTIFNE